jgi:hypothetical protein
LGKVQLTVKRRVERQFGAGGEVMDDLGHRPSFVTGVEIHRIAAEVLQHFHRRRIPQWVAWAWQVSGRN